MKKAQVHNEPFIKRKIWACWKRTWYKLVTKEDTPKTCSPPDPHFLVWTANSVCLRHLYCWEICRFSLVLFIVERFERFFERFKINMLAIQTYDGNKITVPSSVKEKEEGHQLLYWEVYRGRHIPVQLPCIQNAPLVQSAQNFRWKKTKQNTLDVLLKASYPYIS